MPKIACISDPHGFHEEVVVPMADVVACAGDVSGAGDPAAALQKFLVWFAGLPHQYKVFIAGNHDWIFMNDPELAKKIIADFDVIYLQDSGYTIPDLGEHGLRIWGSPWTPPFLQWAFMKERSKMVDLWAQIPEETHVLITHGPAYGYGDKVARYRDHKFEPPSRRGRMQHKGDKELLKAIKKIQPNLHVCGHIHEGYGDYKIGETLSLNASVLDADYEIVNDVRVVELK